MPTDGLPGIHWSSISHAVIQSTAVNSVPVITEDKTTIQCISYFEDVCTVYLWWDKPLEVLEKYTKIHVYVKGSIVSLYIDCRSSTLLYGADMKHEYYVTLFLNCGNRMSTSSACLNIADIFSTKAKERIHFPIFLRHFELKMQMINLPKIMEINFFYIVFTENENSHTNCHKMQHLTKLLEIGLWFHSV